MVDQKSFGERLRGLREAAGWTQVDLARRLSLDRSTVACYEAGRRTPDVHTAARIAALFGVSVDYLLGRTDVRQPAAPSRTSDDELERAIVALRGQLSPEDREEILKFIEWVKERNRRRREQEKPKP